MRLINDLGGGRTPSGRHPCEGGMGVHDVDLGTGPEPADQPSGCECLVREAALPSNPMNGLGPFGDVGGKSGVVVQAAAGDHHLPHTTTGQVSTECVDVGRDPGDGRFEDMQDTKWSLAPDQPGARLRVGAVPARAHADPTECAPRDQRSHEARRAGSRISSGWKVVVVIGCSPLWPTANPPDQLYCDPRHGGGQHRNTAGHEPATARRRRLCRTDHPGCRQLTV